MRILLIDDHHLIGRSLEVSLKSYSEISDFFYLSDPKKALEVVDSYMPSIILMDICVLQDFPTQYCKEKVHTFAPEIFL